MERYRVACDKFFGVEHRLNMEVDQELVRRSVRGLGSVNEEEGAHKSIRTHAGRIEQDWVECLMAVERVDAST